MSSSILVFLLVNPTIPAIYPANKFKWRFHWKMEKLITFGEITGKQSGDFIIRNYKHIFGY